MRALARSVAISIALSALPALAQQPGIVTYGERPAYLDPSFQKPPYEVREKGLSNYAIALGEVIAVDALIWGIDYASGKPYAKISADSISQNFNKGWIIDTDDFWANSLMHPLHGNLNFNAGRTLGLNFYESFAGAFIGSLIWEQFAEIQPPSMNDQVNTPFGGTMVGEVAFRLSRLVLDSGGYAPSNWRQFFAFLLNPVGGVNRFAFGTKYHGPLLLPPSWLGEFRVGTVIAGSEKTQANGARDSTVGPWGSVSAHIVYGIPGTPDLELKQPFDHFEASGSLSLTSDITVQPTASLLVRGLLLGDTLSLGGQPGGLWGLFTSYDFIAPHVFRVQGFGVGPGVALMKRWGSFELHGTTLAEFLPWSGGGSTIPLGVRDYHYGPGGDVVLELRGHFGDRVITRLEGRQYWITGAYANGSSEDISYGKADVTVRIYGIHGATASLDWAHRQAHYPFQPDVWQRASTIGVYYTALQGW
ncbi:MAG: DUF3943 domain-containing protein [Myxococcales bacterium]